MDPKLERDTETLLFVAYVFGFVTLVVVAVHLAVRGHDGWSTLAAGGAGGYLYLAVRSGKNRRKITKENSK